ncbi:MAG: quinol:electron acceptor oxidoreductase subunit ActD [Blastocatellia bacterium]
MFARIVAVIDGAEEALSDVDSLCRQGLPRAAITVMSAEPLHIEPLEGGRRKSRIGGYAIAGGLMGAAFALALTVWTSRRVDLITGGMPIVTPWAFGIIVFELTALGSILAALSRMIFEARLARRGPLAEYNEAVADGLVVLAIDCGDDDCAETAKRILGDKIQGVRNFDSSGSDS